MHTTKTASESLQFLWGNYLTLCEKVDLDSVPQDVLEFHTEIGSLVRPFRITAWLARQGYFISAWSLWEYYSRSICRDLPIKEAIKSKESTVDWVARSLAANGRSFADYKWFASANCIRNLIAHSGARVDRIRGERLLQRSRVAFPDMETFPDGYLTLEHAHVADLQLKIEGFIGEAA